MATDIAAVRDRAPPINREIPHTVSPGLWVLAWRRLKSDRVGMVSLVIVVAFTAAMAGLATTVFYTGLRRYESGSLVATQG